jgi:hypothetical protein
MNTREFNSATLLAEIKRETLANIAPDMLQTLALDSCQDRQCQRIAIIHGYRT